MFCSPLLFSPPSHLLLSILLTLPSALRSHFSTAALEVIHFTNPKKANYLRFYDFHYFTTHTGFYDCVVDYQHLVHTCTHTHVIHIHTCSKQYTHTGEERPEKHVYEDLDVCVYTVFGLCVKWRIMTPGQINHVGFKYIILSSREERWAVPLSISNIQRRHCLRNNNSKGHFSAEIRRERQSVPTANFSIIKFLLTTKNMFMGTIQYIWVSTAACVYVCVCTAAICASCVLACLHMWSTTVYHS